MGRRDAGPPEADDRPRRAPGSRHAARGPAPRPPPREPGPALPAPARGGPQTSQLYERTPCVVCVISVRASNFTFETLTFKF